MPRTTLTKLASSGPYPTGTVADTLTWTGADVANLNDFVLSGNEVLLIRNTDAGAQSYTLTSASDPFKRTKDLTESLAAGAFRFYEASELTAWLQSDGKFYLQAAAATVQFAVIQLKRKG